MRKIEDYLHLYLGCECLWEQEHENHGGVEILDGHLIESVRSAVRVVKPVLRQPSSMTEEEMLEIFQTCYRSVYDHPCEVFLSSRLFNSEDGGGLLVTENVLGRIWRYGLTVTPGGITFSADSLYLSIPIFDVTIYLISKHFDLFGLIESGLAIDAATLTPNK